MVHRDCNCVIKCVQLMMQQWVLVKGFFFCGEFLTLGDKIFQIFGKKFLVKIWLFLLKIWEFSPHFGNHKIKYLKKNPATGSHHPVEREGGPTQLEGNLHLSSIFKSITPHSAPQWLMIDPPLNTPKKKVLGGHGK
jgi:hypothetical protein